MADNAIPSKDPADEGSLAGTLNFIIKKYLQKNIDDMLPAKVISYDRIKNLATVQPMIMIKNTEGETTARCQYASVPVFSFGGGGIGINFPLQRGDLGWIHANDRDISLYMQSHDEAAPNTKRLHSFRDALFYPDSLWNLEIDSEDENAAVFQLYNNTSKISINRDGKVIARAGDSKITMLANGTITVDYNTATFNGTTTTLNSHVVVNGNFDASGGTFTHNGVNVGSTHKHSGVQSGPSNTGNPI